MRFSIIINSNVHWYTIAYTLAYTCIGLSYSVNSQIVDSYFRWRFISVCGVYNECVQAVSSVYRNFHKTGKYAQCVCVHLPNNWNGNLHNNGVFRAFIMNSNCFYPACRLRKRVWKYMCLAHSHMCVGWLPSGQGWGCLLGSAGN